jgi:hypothetical protein
MSVANECYNYIIGLYRGDCACYGIPPEDYDISDSGLYLSDLLEPKFIDGLLNCDQGDSIWELMEVVRDLAVQYFIADSNALLMQSNKLKRNPFYGGIGSSIWTKDLSIVDGYRAGVRVISPLIRGGYLKIKKIGLLLNTTQALTLTIYNRNGTLLHTINLNAVADSHTNNDIPDITLPLFDEYLDYMEYWFIYTVSGFQPKNNGRYSCASCIKSKPGWGSYFYDSKIPWAHWVNVGGFTSDGLPDFNSTSSGTDKMNGLTFQVELACMVGEVFCEDQLDYNGNTLAQAMAVAIQKKSAALFVEKIMNTQNLNRAVMINHESLTKSRDEWLVSYNEMIAYIVENVDISANDCFECKDIIEMIQGGIFA